jgi:hypothetical protein
MKSILFSLLFLFLAGISKAQDINASDSIVVGIYPDYNSVSGSHRFWLGENNRKLWAVPVKIRKINLKSEKGGLSVVKLGGGMQTKSLRLKDPSGQEWVIRTLQKYPDRKLAENLKHTVANDILQDQVSAINPFGALVVPVFADALGIPHAVPEIVYVGQDPGLGIYEKEFSNTVYLMESRFPDEDSKSDNTEKAQRKMQENNEFSADQKLVLRARLLDILLGDWDRHEDQWRWDKEKKGDETVYSPVPRDRDQVFYRTAGVFPWIISHQWLKSRFQPFDHKLRDVKGWNFGARYFDRYFLNSLDEAEWMEQVKYVQHVMNDTLIKKAVSVWPDSVQHLVGPGITGKIKSRRNDLAVYAMEYYRFLAGTVDIPASEKNEQIEVNMTGPKTVMVWIHNLKKDGTTGRSIYKRTFNADITKEIRLYGIAGKDIFKVNGTGDLPLKVRLVGGKDEDTFLVATETKSRSGLFIYDKQGEKNNLPDAGKAKLRLSKDSLVHAFDSKTFKFNRTGPLVLANYNIDQGILLKLGFLDERQGFRKNPYAIKQEFWANYSTGRKSFSFDYDGDFKQAVGQNDLVIDVNVRGPHNFGNFFGKGNNTVFPNEGDREISFYRNRYDYVNANFKLRRTIATRWKAELGLGTEYYTSSQENNEKRYFDTYNELNPADGIYTDRLFLGVSGGVHYDTRNKISSPSRGVYWNTEFTAKAGVTGGSRNYSRILSEMNAYLSLKDSSIVLANRIGAGTSFGDPMFFQQMQLGGQNNLRGFHTNRFSGKTMFYHNLELRMKLFDFNSYLVPGSVGVIGFNDIGRVWQPGEKSDKWHHGYGGGIYVIPADLIIIQGAAGFSKEGALPYISLGFQF